VCDIDIAKELQVLYCSQVNEKTIAEVSEVTCNANEIQSLIAVKQKPLLFVM